MNWEDILRESSLPQEVVMAIKELVDTIVLEINFLPKLLEKNLPNEVSQELADLMRERFERYYKEGRWDGTLPVNIIADVEYSQN